MIDTIGIDDTTEKVKGVVVVDARRKVAAVMVGVDGVNATTRRTLSRKAEKIGLW